MAFQNFFATKLQNTIGSSDTTIKVQTPPTVTSGRLVIEPRNPSKREIIQFTGVSGTDLTGVVRGIGGTSATTHNGGSLVQMNVLAEDLEDALNINGNLTQYTDELFADSVVRGTGEVTAVSGREASISNITYYINGIRLTKTGIPNKTFTASRDTYCYIDTAGNITYVEAAQHAGAAASPPANSILFAIVLTGATTITRVYHHNFDSSRVPHLFELTSTSASGGAGAYAGIAGMTATVIIPETREYSVELNIPTIYASNVSTQYNFRVQFNVSTILATASHAPSALSGNPTNFSMKRKITLQRGVYQQSAQWYSIVAGTNSLQMGGAPTMPVTVTVTAV